MDEGHGHNSNWWPTLLFHKFDSKFLRHKAAWIFRPHSVCDNPDQRVISESIPDIPIYFQDSNKVQVKSSQFGSFDASLMPHHQYQRCKPNTKLQSQGQLQHILRFKFNATATAKSQFGSSDPTLKLVRGLCFVRWTLRCGKKTKNL